MRDFTAEVCLKLFLNMIYVFKAEGDFGSPEQM